MLIPNRTANGYDPTQDLAELPSDAFSSSAPFPEEQDGFIQAARVAAPLTGLRQTTLFGRNGEPVPASQANKRRNWPLANRDEPPPHHQIDPDAMKTWVYPTNLGKIRDYQFNIIHRGLYHNLLCALPTGLGKTFIAATIILNWYRWTKSAQIVFVAPTKPLVAQQVEACFNIAGIPRSQTTMLTGDVSTALRSEEWNNKRVFFMTPQTLINDLKTGICDPKRIVLLVIDEAHRATGAYAYVEVVKFVRRFNDNFRVLALTATPGDSVETVQRVIDGLEISRCEIRTEQSLDIREYVHQKEITKQVFDPTEEIELIQGFFAQAAQPMLDIVNKVNAYWLKDPLRLTRYGCLEASHKYMRSDAARHANPGLKNMVRSAFDVLGALGQALELLKYYSIRGFYEKLLKFRAEANDPKKKGKYRKQVDKSEPFERMMVRLHAWTSDPDWLGHPKLEQVRSDVLQHFIDAGEGENGKRTSTRVEIFSKYRESVEEICRVLQRDSPIVRPHQFVGQSSSKNSEGMSQKKQLEVTNKFKNGDYNVLVSTSVGEEGLDIGEVDMIVCYDSSASPIRLLQRMGRTGRKREGRVVWMQMRGKEQIDATKAIDNYEKMQELIASGDQFNFHHDRSRRMVPKEIQPIVDKRVVEIPIENTQRTPSDFLPVPTKKGRGKLPKRPAKKFHMPDGVRTGFTMAGRMDDNDEGAESYMEDAERIPLLEEVFLPTKDMLELERRYQSFAGDDEDVVIARPVLDKYPLLQRRAGKTDNVSHGTRTKAFVETMTKLASLDEYSVQEQEANFRKAYLEPEDIGKTLTENKPMKRVAAKQAMVSRKDEPTLPRGGSLRAKTKTKTKTTPVRNHKQPGEDLSDMEAEPSSAPASSPRMAMAKSQAITLGSADTSGSEAEENDYIDSDLEDFVVDDAEPLSEVESSLPSPSKLFKRPQMLFRGSQLSNVESSQDLPDLGTLIGSTAKQKQRSDEIAPVAAGKSKQIENRQAKKRRKVVSDDEDD